MRGLETPEQLHAWLAARGGARIIGHDTPRHTVSAPLPTCLVEEHPRPPCWPYRSRTEQRYAQILDQWQHEGRVTRWRYEALRLRLAPATTLTIDFVLTMAAGTGDGRMQLHEVKPWGWAREDSMVKLKQAATLYPEFRVFLVQGKKDQWIWKEIPCQ